jgi:hypothetical protein
MPSVLSKDEWPAMVLTIVEKGLMDDSVEVRIKAAQVLAGLLHCAFINKEGRENILVSIKMIFEIKQNFLAILY